MLQDYLKTVQLDRTTGLRIYIMFVNYAMGCVVLFARTEANDGSYRV